MRAGVVDISAFEHNQIRRLIPLTCFMMESTSASGCVMLNSLYDCRRQYIESNPAGSPTSHNAARIMEELHREHQVRIQQPSVRGNVKWRKQLFILEVYPVNRTSGACISNASSRSLTGFCSNRILHSGWE
jgi:hypothetical protein